MQVEKVPRIAELPATLASQIAAGEVVERPASVVKELLENSIDAGAVAIGIDITEGGHKRIAVSDDGHGIHPDDIELALRRHSTSKLNSQSDLDCITSLGFRGEALASIAAVSRFSLVSRVEQSDAAWSLSFDPVSGNSSLKPAARARGTTIEALDIFQSTPARRKFLRSQTTEFLQIADVVKRAACSRFNITFTLTHNNRPVLRYRACRNDMMERVTDVFGGKFTSQSIAVNYESRGMSLWGWLGGGELSRSQSDRQFCFVNGRAVRDKKIFHAVRLAFADTLPAGRYPCYLLHLDIDPATTDINVHPTKSEIRFRNTRSVHDFIHVSLRDALKTANTLDLGNADAADAAPAAASGAQVYAGHSGRRPPSQVKEAELFYRNITHKETQDDLLIDNAGLGLPLTALADRIGIAQRGREYVLIDLQAARKYLLRYRLGRDYRNRAVRRRPLLVPVNLEAGPGQIGLVEKYMETLEEIGLSMRIVADDAIVIKTIPALLEEADVKALAQAVLAGLQGLENRGSPGADPGTGLLEAMTGNLELRTGTLNNAAMQSLLNELDRTDLDTTQQHRKGLWRTVSLAEFDRLIGS